MPKLPTINRQKKSEKLSQWYAANYESPIALLDLKAGITGKIH